MQRQSSGGPVQFLAQLGHEVFQVDEADLRTAPQMIVHLGNGFHARAGVLQRGPDVFGWCAPRLHAEQAYHRSQAVLDAMAHLSRQQFLMLERLPKLGIGLLALDGDTKQAGKACNEMGVRLVELARIRAVDFKNAEGLAALPAPLYEHVDGAPDTVIRQKLRCAETRLGLQMV